MPLEQLLDFANGINFLALLLVAGAGMVIAFCSAVLPRWQSRQDAYRADIFQIKIEELRNENLKLQAALAPRVLSEEQIHALKSLRGKISRVNISSETDADSQYLAAQIARTLQSIDIQVRGFDRAPSTHSTANMVYDQTAFQNPNGQPTGGEPLVSALEAAGLLPVRAVLARLPIDLQDAPPDVPIIMIGGKPWMPPIHPFVAPEAVK